MLVWTIVAVDIAMGISSGGETLQLVPFGIGETWGLFRAIKLVLEIKCRIIMMSLSKVPE